MFPICHYFSIMLKLAFVFFVASNITQIDIDDKMAAIFDGDTSTCENIQDSLFKRSYIFFDNIHGIDASIAFNVKVEGLSSCKEQVMLYTLNGSNCGYFKKCKVTNDLAGSHNTCIIECPCDDECKILTMFYSKNGNIHGSVCEISLM